MERYKKRYEKSEMENFFEKRTNYHINLVRKYLDKIIQLNLNNIDNIILEQEKVEHDYTKFIDPEYEPYLYITWDYKCKDEGVEFNIPEKIKEEMNKATHHHILNNKHHPEFWSENTISFINKDDRDKPSEKIFNCTKMPFSYIGCMVADWLAMSEEKGTNPFDWIEKNVNTRWEFTKDQKKFIIYLTKMCWL